MKQVMVLLVLITLVINGVAFADAPICDVEIKFRGLEWGCSIDEAMANIQGQSKMDILMVKASSYILKQE